MALTESQKRHFAWEFLKRNPEYLEFWVSHKSELGAIKPKSKWQYRRTRESLLARKQVIREDTRIAMHRWCLTKVVDPGAPLKSAELEKLFRNVRPVTPFFDAPWPGDSRLYLAIDAFGSLEVIDQAIHAELKKHKARLKIPQRERKKPREMDLQYHLAILDCYRDHLRGPSAESRQLPNYGYTKGWAKLAEALQKKFDASDDKTQRRVVNEAYLRDGIFQTALSLRDQSPFCFLG